MPPSPLILPSLCNFEQMDPVDPHVFLDNVIKSCPDAELICKVLREVCKKSDEACEIACSMLLLERGALKAATDPALQYETVKLKSENYPEEEDEEEEDHEENEDQDGDESKSGRSSPIISPSDYSEAEGPEEQKSSSKGLKRKRSYTRQRYEICAQCGDRYDVLSNPRYGCTWHEGEVYMDDEEIDYCDYRILRPGDYDYDSDELAELFPNASKWTCCNREAEDPGCKQSIHRPDRAKRAKRSAPAETVAGNSATHRDGSTSTS